MSELPVFEESNYNQKVELLTNLHETWSRGMTLREHLDFRLASAQHHRARWYVGCRGGRVVCSLGAYPVQFWWHDAVINGILIGAVYTCPEFRGRGFASALINWVEQTETAEQGVKASALYSDVGTDYYVQMGYCICPSRELQADVGKILSVGKQPEGWSLRKMDLNDFDETDTLAQLYQKSLSQRAFGISRDYGYWAWSFARMPVDVHYRIIDDAEITRGYVRLHRDEPFERGAEPERIAIWDYALEDHSSMNFQRLIRLVAARAAEVNIPTIVGWVPEVDLGNIGTTISRSEEIMMIKSLADDLEVDESIRLAAACVSESDHV